MSSCSRMISLAQLSRLPRSPVRTRFAHFDRTSPSVRRPLSTLTNNTVYDKKFNKSIDGPAAVVNIVVAGTSAISTADDKSLYHWHTYFDIGSRSVLFDMIPGADGETGILLVMSKATTSAATLDVLKFSVTPSPETTVQTYLDFVIANGLDRYKYHSTGSGCRWWCETLLQKLEETHLIAEGSAQAFRAWVAEEVKKHPANIPIPIRKGTFY